MTGQRHSVLIVEDDYEQFAYLKRFFETQGFNVLCKDRNIAVDNYDDAVAIIDAHLPDLIMLDIKINGSKSGFDIAEYVNARYLIPMIVFSESRGISAVAKRLGVDQTITKVPEPYRLPKPFDEDALINALGSCRDEMEKHHKQKSLGALFSVHLQENLDAAKNAGKQPLDPPTKAFILWRSIYTVTANNKQRNNTILITTKNPDNSFVVVETLENLKNVLPEYCIQVNRDTIVNLHFVSKPISKNSTLFLGKVEIKISQNVAEVERFLKMNFLNA